MDQHYRDRELQHYRAISPSLDYTHPRIEQLISERRWNTFSSTSDLIRSLFTFVRDEIAFGYALSHSLSASATLELGYGSAISKSTLLMALLRAVGIPCRLHASTIDKGIFRGLLGPLTYRMLPSYPFHSWVEVMYNSHWVALEGYAVDSAYIAKLHQKFPDYMGSFYGYGLAVLNFKNPTESWNSRSSSAQNRAKEKDLGIFATPDAFFAHYPQLEAFTQSFLYRHLLRKVVNKNIKALRKRR